MPAVAPSWEAQPQIGVFNTFTPKEGPKTVPVQLQFAVGVTAITVDLTLMRQRKYISMVQSIFVDNSLNASAVTITCPRTQQTIVVPPEAQGWFPGLVPNEPVLQCFSSGAVVVTLQLCNFYVPPFLWSINNAGGGNLNSNGFLETADQNLATIISGGNASVVLNGEANGNIVKPVFSADEIFSGNTATNTAQTITTGTPGYFITGFDISLTGDATTGAAVEYTVTVKAGATTIFTKIVNLPAASGTGSLIPVLSASGLQFDGKTALDSLTIQGSAVLTAGKLQWIFYGGVCSQVG